MIMVIARLGGSPADTLTIIWLAFVSIVISGAAGWMAGRRKQV
jgi:LPXTG-motif cell wall-anchored protein